MPKMYRIVSGGSFTWVYVDRDKNDKVLARSTESWDTRKQVRDAIDEMKRAAVENDREE
jgi:uncharacterized protein YegP (UPF0339 family)